ncbi:MAG: hypothetical protein WCC59_16945 [Terriglobales bacterium]
MTPTFSAAISRSRGHVKITGVTISTWSSELTIFVQFYPTLLQVAKKKNTLSPAYGEETASAEAAH